MSDCAATEPSHFQPAVQRRDDGALTNGDYERVALRMAEGMGFHEAWAAIGKKTNGNGQRQYRNRIQKDPLFRGRVAMIEAEKTELEKLDELFGEPIFMFNQLWREALAVGDIARMQKAAEMRLECAKQLRGFRRELTGGAEVPEAPAVETDEPKRPVGKPVTENPQAQRGLDKLTEGLLARKVPLPDDAEAVS